MAACRMLNLSESSMDGPEEALRVLDEGDEDADGDGVEDARGGAGAVAGGEVAQDGRSRRTRGRSAMATEERNSTMG